MKHKASVSIEAALVMPFVFLTIVAVYTLIGYLHMDYQISRAATEAALDFSHDSFLLYHLDLSELLAHHSFQRQSLKPADIVKMEEKVRKFGQSPISFETPPEDSMLRDFNEIVNLSKKMLENIQKTPSELPGIAKTEATVLASRWTFGQYIKYKICKYMEDVSGFSKERLEIEAGRYLYDFKASTFYVSYRHQFPLKLSFMKEARILQPIYVESFIGNIIRYKGEKYKEKEKKEEDKEDDPIVFMVNTQTYHTQRECFVLNPKPMPISKNNLTGKGKHQQCATCKNANRIFGDTVYKTKNGSVYHATLDCSRIRREVKECKLSEVGAANRCKHCIKAEKGKE